MSKREFSKGTLVRKKTIGGIPVGEWMLVEVANSSHVYAKYIGGKDVIMLSRKNVYKPKTAQVCISKDAMERILHGDIVISHIATPAWKKLLDSKVEVIMFYTQDGWKKAWCTVETIYCIPLLRERIIKVLIDRLIYRQPLL